MIRSINFGGEPAFAAASANFRQDRVRVCFDEIKLAARRQPQIDPRVSFDREHG
jgi:hypothetical protein